MYLIKRKVILTSPNGLRNHSDTCRGSLFRSSISAILRRQWTISDGTRGTFLEFRKNKSLPALAVGATAAHWVLMALCDARIGFPAIFPLDREVFFGFYKLSFPVFLPLARGFFQGFYICFLSFFALAREVFFEFFVLRTLAFSRFFL